MKALTTFALCTTIVLALLGVDAVFNGQPRPGAMMVILALVFAFFFLWIRWANQRAAEKLAQFKSEDGSAATAVIGLVAIGAALVAVLRLQFGDAVLLPAAIIALLLVAVFGGALRALPRLASQSTLLIEEGWDLPQGPIED